MTHVILMNKYRHKLNDTQRAEIEALYAQGLTHAKIADMYGVRPCSITATLQKRGIKGRDASVTRRRYALDEEFFASIDTEAKAYVLGFIYGDGAVCHQNSNMTICGPASDRQVYEDMQRALGSERPLKVDRRGYMLFSVSSKRMKDDLARLGVIPNKTKTLRFPAQHMDQSLYRHFIRGLFDSDGSICLRRDTRCATHVATWSIFSTRSMLERVRGIMMQHGIRLNELCHDKRCYTESAILATSRCQSLHDLYAFLYTGSTICLERKKEILRRVLESKPSCGK